MKSDKSIINAWYVYDWAVSAFTTTVVTVLIGPYLTEIAKSASVNGYLNILGINVYAGSYFNYVISVSVFLQVLFLPLIGSLSDHSGKKRMVFISTAYIGAISTVLMYFLEGTAYIYGGLLLIVSNLAFGSSMVVYNSYLNDIAEENERDLVSSRGYAWGYVGGGLLLLLNLILIMNVDSLGLTTGEAVRISLCSAGLWWGIFAIIPAVKFKRVLLANQNLTSNKNLISSSIQIFKTIKESFKYPQTLLFVCAYMIFNDGVQAVIVVSAQFGQEALNIDISTLTSVILMVQFVAYFGAVLFSYLAKKFGSKNSLIISLVIWILIIIYAYQFLNGVFSFYMIGILIGLVLGGTQAISRSIYSLLIPRGKEAEYYSLYEVSERGTSWIGPLLFGLSLQFSESHHFAILSLGVLFVVGLILLSFVNFKKGIADVGNVIPVNIR